MFTVRLVNGASAKEGRVEIFHAGEWGSVCDDNWTTSNAQVVCRQLGFSEGSPLEDTEYGESTGQIWLDEVNCHGYENNLSDCNSNAYGVNDCWNFEDAGVICGKVSTKFLTLSLRITHVVVGDDTC